MISHDVYLTIKHGETETRNTLIPLTHRQILLGRKWDDILPQVRFISPYISRKHAMIEMDNENFFIVDLMSKHGTQVNHSYIEKNRPCVLHDGDTITLAKGTAILSFHNTTEGNHGQTLEMPSIHDEKINESKGLTVHFERREISIDGVQIYLTSKDTELFWLLYQKANSAVSYDEIKLKIWPERVSHDSGRPDVGREEVNTLVYRLRRKLGTYGRLIISVPRFGYMLDLDSLQ